MNPPTATANARSAARTSVGGNVWAHCYRTPVGEAADVANGLLDVSSGGAQLLVKELFRTGDVVRVVLGGAGLHSPIDRRGEVRWVVQLGEAACFIGVRFDEPVDDTAMQTLMPMAVEAPDAFDTVGQTT